MKKVLLSLCLVLSGLAANAQGITKAGANVVVLPSSQYDGSTAWSATTWVYNTGMDFGDPQNETNSVYNYVWAVPPTDAAGHEWYEAEYDTTGVAMEDENGEMILWETHEAPFSSDEKYNGRTSYRWTTSNIMAEMYFRRTFTTDQLLSGPVYLACGHDDAPAEYYINGELVFEATDGWDNSKYIMLTDEQKSLIKLNGQTNVIAVHVHQNWGGAFADCGLYTKVEGGLDMGYDKPWEAKVLFNSIGGYNFDGQSPSNDPKHPWSPLYEAKEGDVYTIHLTGSSIAENTWQEQVHFKTPITISSEKAYTFKLNLTSEADYSNVIVKLTDNTDDGIEGAYQETSIVAGETTEVEMTLSDVDIENMKIAFDFGGGKDSTAVVISNISLVDDDTDQELWVGTHYFNYFHVTKNVEKRFITEYNDDGEPTKRYVKEGDEEYESAEIENVAEAVTAPEVEGRTESMAWTLPEFDDSMWSDQMMPVGNSGYMNEVQSIWPGGDNTNYWIRRNFTLDKVNERLSYALNVCHDDVYETYVNGHLLQKNVGWTNGKNPVQVHIPAKYLIVGKNVIATYIQQNWGGKFYDCGINVEEVNYDECAAEMKKVVEKAEKTDATLTKAMQDVLAGYIAEGKDELANNKDAAEIKENARVLGEKIDAVLGYSNDVKILIQTISICNTTKDNGYLAAVLEDVKANVDTCKTNSQTNTLLDKLRVARKRNALERHTEPYVGCVPEIAPAELTGDFEGPQYYIYNVGEKLFLGAGESWGTHLALEYTSNAMMLIQQQDEEGNDLEGQYRIETFRPNGNYGEMDFMNWGGFIDTGSKDSWELIPVEGKTNVYNIAQYGQTNGKTGGKNYLGFRNGDNNYNPSWNVVDTDMRSPELESNQWMFISKEEMNKLMETATETNPIDASHLLMNPGFDQRLDVESSWFDYSEDGNHSVWGRGGNHPDFCYEGWRTQSFDLQQELMDQPLLPGWYTLRFQGYYRDGGYDTHVKKLINGETPDLKAFAYVMDPEGEYKVTVRSITDGSMMVPGRGRLDETGTVRIPDACSAATEYFFQNGLYWNTLKFKLEDGETEWFLFGVMKDLDETAEYDADANRCQDWIVLDNFRLTYYGGNEPEVEDAIEKVNADGIVNTPKAQKVIFNLAGQRMSKLQKGVNILNGKKYIVK